LTPGSSSEERMWASIVIKIEIVWSDPAGSKKPPIEHNRPNDQHCRRDNESQESFLWPPAKKETISPRRRNEKYEQGGHANSKANGSDMYGNRQLK
jgi:hypothetical protein